MDDHEIPHHFICPISLQIMKDPVTVATGITYDRDSIQRWLQSAAQNSNTCPVTNQPLPIAADFTPNHNLLRLIQSWTTHVSDQLPPSKQSSFHIKVTILNLIKNLNQTEFQLQSLKSLENLALESEVNRDFLKDYGVVNPIFAVVISCYQNCKIVGLKEALNILYLVGLTKDSSFSVQHDRIIDSLIWVLDLDDSCGDDDDITFIKSMKSHAIVLLKDIVHNAKSHVLERLNRGFFKTIVLILRKIRESNNLDDEHGRIKEVLHIMLTACTWPRNCSMMIDSEAVFELVEIELGSPKKATTELIMAVLFHLCSSADGRAQLLGHAAGIAVLTKRIGRVSRKVDERALMIISLISKFSGTEWVLQEMARVGTIQKLCMVLQVIGRYSNPREKAREILKRHSNVWKDSPCLNLTLRTRYPAG